MDQNANSIILSNHCIIIELFYVLIEWGLALHQKIIPERQKRYCLAGTFHDWLHSCYFLSFSKYYSVSS